MKMMVHARLLVILLWYHQLNQVSIYAISLLVILENGFTPMDRVILIVMHHGFSHHLVESIHVLSLAQLANTGTPLHQHVKLIVMLLSSMNPMPIFVFAILLITSMLMVLVWILVKVIG